MIEIVEAMTTYNGGILNQFKIQLDAKGPKLYPMFIWGQVIVNLVPVGYLPHLRKITSHFKYESRLEIYYTSISR